MRAVRVTTAAGSAARDAAAIAAGTPSRALMQRAGAAAAAELARRYAPLLHRGVQVAAGVGNNGGDACVVARALAAAGLPVTVAECGEPRTDDARAERTLALGAVELGWREAPALAVDGLLGTGARGAPRESVASAVRRLRALGDAGVPVVALDVPSGVDATTGAAELAVRADLTLSFGTLRRGLLRARELAGRIAVLDIGLGEAGDDDGAPSLVTGAWVRDHLPGIAANAHKGTRCKLAVAGGAAGMAGAAVLAARAAMRSGVGMVRLLVPRESLPAVQGAEPHALASEWPDTTDAARDLLAWADALLIGPGLGRAPAARALVERLLGAWHGPVVLDADALTIFSGELEALRGLLRGRPALLTPHPLELARLAGRPLDDVLATPFEAGGALAVALGATVLLKGVPTVVTAPGGESLVSATGTPALAQAGSGDLLAGVAATLLAQTRQPLTAGGAAAWAHGRAAELAGEGRTVRGVTLGDVELALGAAWAATHDPAPAYPVRAELPPVQVELPGWAAMMASRVP